ncbi:hypothetical protein JYT99_01790, partial [bacterium AH-315-E09]|nr:hypothetical protein [bacterium AH-315-E09]
DEEKKVFEKIKENYNNMNKMMVEEMDMASTHGGLTGNYREKMWVKFFRSIVPKKFAIEQGVLIIDSNGNVSKEVDIAIFDEQYTPYVFQYNTLKFIPIEAVAVVIECKSKSIPVEDLKKWSAEINNLEAKRSGIARMVTGYVSGETNNTQTGTRPIKILVSLKSYVDKNANKEDSVVEKLKNDFDIIITEKKQKEPTEVEPQIFTVKIENEKKTLKWWGEELNKKGVDKDGNKSNKEPEGIYNKLLDLKISDNEILSLNLQLNQLLMLINNPMLFPHFAYAKQFNIIVEKNK